MKSNYHFDAGYLSGAFMEDKSLEFNFDGLIGPTHNYAGLSFGNVASAAHQHQPSHPRAAALQGLKKMKTLAAMGIEQAVLPPLRRPRIELLQALGFRGARPADVLEAAYWADPRLVAACYSAASMWTANAATVSPSVDCDDGRLHLTPANLSSTLHRSLEAPSTFRMLNFLFADSSCFEVHDPLPSAAPLSDEGAANHTRFCCSFDQPGLELFVYGADTERSDALAPKKFPARQTRLASESIARHHRLNPDRTLFWQQRPEAIDAGVFHNDVISVGHQNVLLCHEFSFVDQANQLDGLKRKFESTFGEPLHVIEFSANEISLDDAVASYLFNSQVVTRPDGQMTLICPIECEELESAFRCGQRVISEPNPVDRVVYLNLRQSMNNGGGPACLRLRVVLSPDQQNAFHQGVRLTDKLAARLENWINQHYREQLLPDDLRDPALIDESYAALEALGGILGIPREVILDGEGAN